MGGQSGGGNRERGSRGRRDICWRFNRGRCSYGMNCKFDHRCNVCMKFGHGAHICRKAGENADRDFDRGRNGGTHDRDPKDREGDKNKEQKLNNLIVAKQ